MKRTLLAACLTFSLTACHKEPPPAPVASPAVPVQNLAPLAPPPVATAVLIPDAGVGEPPVDMLAIAHEADGVDHVEIAQSLRRDGDLEGALTEARKAIAENANDEDALDLVGRLAMRTGDDDLAEEAFARLGAIESEDATPLIQEARVLLKADRFDDALAAANEAVKRDDENPEGYQALGRAYLGQNHLEPAIEAFQKAVELAPDHGFALNNLGLAYLRANRNGDAVEVLSRAADLLPDIAFVQNNLGIALEREGKRDEAQVAYGHAMSLSPKYLKAQLNAQRMASADPQLIELPEPGPVDAQ
jgi:tetratricopeptide (TPR) repeat protein